MGHSPILQGVYPSSGRRANADLRHDSSHGHASGAIHAPSEAPFTVVVAPDIGDTAAVAFLVRWRIRPSAVVGSVHECKHNNHQRSAEHAESDGHLP